MQVSDDLFLGPALGPNPLFGSDGNPAPMSQGVGPMGRFYLWDVVPAALVANSVATAQAVAGAGNLTLTFGLGGTTRITRPSGGLSTVLDTPRGLTMVSTNAGDTTQTATINGTDLYGQAVSQRITLNGTTPVLTTKAFKIIDSITISAVTVGNISAGTTNVLGMPIRVTDRGYLDPSWNNTLARDASTIVVADATTPATNLTGDVRGTLTPSTATDGVKRLVVCIGVPGIASGPQATRIGAFGVTQA